jgi:hypothetical protein
VADIERPAPAELRSGEFDSAWLLLDAATNAVREMAGEWNDLVGSELFRSNVYIDDDGMGYLDVLIDEYEGYRLEPFEDVARRFADALLGCAREAVLAAEQCVSRPLRSPGGEHLPRFPLFGTVSEFVGFLDSGALSGLRPDQIQLIEQFQPFYRWHVSDDVRQQVQAVLTRLFNLATVREGNARPVIAFWAHSASPIVEVDSPAVVSDVQCLPDGVLVDSHRVATFRAPPGAAGLRANPNIAFDPILNVEPWPEEPDDNMDVQCRGLVRMVEELICALDRSVGLREPLTEGRFRLVPIEDDPVWARVDISEAPDIEAGLRSSELGLATYRASDDFIMLVQRPDGVYGRIVPVAEALDRSLERGTAAEGASRDSASRWGLSDFVFQPGTVQRGSATREVGDGTIVCGDRGLAVQVKARTEATDQPERERAWISKKAKEGARQASGSVRTVRRNPTPHVNARGRSITIDGNAIEWVGVIIIDHDTPPDDVSAYEQSVPIPYVVALRREWDFLFNQLRSTTAVVEYLHRIATDQITPGGHVANYYELALADEQSPPDLAGSRIPASLADPALRTSHPLLPIEPASAADEYGARMYRQILEDIALSPWDREESDRVNVLHLLDKLPVAERAGMGRRLLTHMSRAPHVEIGTARWDFRRYLLGNADLHLGYAVCNQFTDLHKEAFRQWVLLRHTEWITALEPDTRPQSTTVAVMLTPRHNHVRPWDTTLYAIFGETPLDPEELAAMQRLWNNPQNMADQLDLE